MSEIDLSQFTPAQLTHLQRDIRKELEHHRQEKVKQQFLQGSGLTTFADLVNMQQAQIEQLEREAYPRKHWTTVEEAYEGRDTRLTAGIGEWKYDPELLTVAHEDHPNYEIYLKDLTTTARLLDSLLQVTKKGWWAYDSFGELVGLLEMICQEKFQNNLQGVFCPFGESRTVQWPMAHGGTEAKTDGEEIGGER